MKPVVWTLVCATFLVAGCSVSSGQPEDAAPTAEARRAPTPSKEPQPKATLVIEPLPTSSAEAAASSIPTGSPSPQSTAPATSTPEQGGVPAASSTPTGPPGSQPATSVAADTPEQGGGPVFEQPGNLAFPAVYEGMVRFNEQPVPEALVGSRVEAIIEDRVCATGTILLTTDPQGGSSTSYSLLQIEFGVEQVGGVEKQVCGRPQAVIRFLIAGSRLALEQAVWRVGPHHVDLNWPAATPLPEGLPAAPTFHGKILVGGAPAADGAVISAFVGPTLCGLATTRDGAYELYLHSDVSMASCGKPGDRVTFTVGRAAAREVADFQAVAQATPFDLTVP